MEVHTEEEGKQDHCRGMWSSSCMWNVEWPSNPNTPAMGRDEDTFGESELHDRFNGKVSFVERDVISE